LYKGKIQSFNEGKKDWAIIDFGKVQSKMEGIIYSIDGNYWWNKWRKYNEEFEEVYQWNFINQLKTFLQGSLKVGSEFVHFS